MDNPKKNAEGYNDPTPYEAEKHIRAQIRGKQADSPAATSSR